MTAFQVQFESLMLAYVRDCELQEKGGVGFQTIAEFLGMVAV